MVGAQVPRLGDLRFACGNIGLTRALHNSEILLLNIQLRSSGCNLVLSNGYGLLLSGNGGLRIVQVLL